MNTTTVYGFCLTVCLALCRVPRRDSFRHCESVTTESGRPVKLSMSEADSTATCGFGRECVGKVGICLSR